MNPALETAATAYIAPKLVRGIKLRWVFYGIAAYYGLKYLNKRGILPKQTDAALNAIDKGIDYAKTQAGFKSNIETAPTVHH